MKRFSLQRFLFDNCDLIIMACTAARAVAKANSQSNGSGQISTSVASKPLDEFQWNVETICVSQKDSASENDIFLFIQRVNTGPPTHSVD